MKSLRYLYTVMTRALFTWLMTLLMLGHSVYSQNAPPVAHFYGIDRPIPESTVPGEVVFHVNATDLDSSRVTMDLDSNTFQLQPNGDVILIKSLNFESSTFAQFVLTASDGTSDTRYEKTIQIEDVNDVSPRFTQLRYQTHLPENTPIGTLVFADVTVTDQDVSNENLKVVCTVTAAFPDACTIFYVNSSLSTNKQWRGDIYLQRGLDYETMQETYQLTLTALDGNDENNYEKTFEIVIDDVTDAPPVFTSTFDTRVNEDVPRGTYIVTIVAVDGDEKDQRDIRYAIVDNPGGYFTIDPVSGNITTATLLDRDMQDVGAQGIITLNVTAQELLTDGSLGSDATTQSFAEVRITVVDVNDNPPSFTQTHYSVRMSEALQNGQAVPNLTMHVTDSDGADNAFFRFVFANLREYEDIFEISPPEAQGSATATLLIRNSSALDYDLGLRQYTLEVIAREVRTSSNLSSTAIVTIYLEDANDNAPLFNVSSYEIRLLSELTMPGQFIASLPTASDIDTGSYGTAGIRYSLIGSGNNKFDVDVLTGELTLRDCTIPGTGNCLDYEAVRQYNLTLIAADNDGSGIETRLPLTITILDENDNVPIFTSESYQYSVQELTTILRTDQAIQATDRDSSRNGNNRIRYSLVTDRTQLFSVDSITGMLNLRQPIQFRDGDEGRIQLIVSAGNLLDGTSVVDFTTNTTVDILVEDVNNNDPIFLRNYTIQILENIRPGVEIIRVTAVDADFGQNAALDYSIVSGSQNTFDIDINTGVISRRNGAILDYDITSSYTMVVRATDRGASRRSGQTYVTIDIIDDNNKNPVFSPPTTYANVSEDADIDFAVVAMQAIDIDTNADLRYSFIPEITAFNLAGQVVNVAEYNYTDLFRINSQTGQVFVNRQLDVTRVQRIIYTVQAVDIAATTGPLQSGTGTLVIDIINANNYAPEFVNLDGDNQVYEEDIVGSLVMIVSALDRDRDIVTYQILDQSLPGAFYINAVTGVVTVASRIDYESVQMINFTVRASDGTEGEPYRTTDQQFSVSVININDNEPKFSQEYYEAEIVENETDRQNVITVLANDLDLPPYGDVRYRLPDTVTRFRIDEESGVIYKISGVLFDREELINEIQIPVIAYDGPGLPSRLTIAPVYIKIKDANDNSPYFSESDLYITLSDQLIVESYVTRVYAFDRDPTDSITYSISNDPRGRYTISSTSGVVSTRLPLTDTPDHVFDVIATDEAGHTAAIRVHVTVIGNRQGPEWIFPSFNGDKITVCENRATGYTINSGSTLISATDATQYNFVINGVVTDQLENKFRIISQTGEITTTGELDREMRDKYLVQVEARDADGLINRRYLLIEICDQDDNDPEFPNYPNGTVKTFVFYVESGVNGCVRDPRQYNQCSGVTAVDLDLPENGRIMYRITDGDFDVFDIDMDTGLISTTRPLDHATRDIRVTVRANNYDELGGTRQIKSNQSPYGTAIVYIHVLPPSVIPSLIKQNVNLYTSIDSQIGSCLETMRPAGMIAGVTYSIDTQVLFDGTARYTQLTEQDSRPRFSVGSQSGFMCTIRLFNPSHAGFHYQINVQAVGNSGAAGNGTANIWLTENIHKIRIVIDGNTEYVNSNRQAITEALQQIIGTNIVWIDSVGHYTTSTGAIDTTKSNVIIYAVNETSRHLFRRNTTTLYYINNRIETSYSTTALYAKILRAEDFKTTYIYIDAAPTAVPVIGGGGGGGFPVGLLVAMLLLLPLLLLPFLLCCLPCLPCGAAGGGKEKYAILGAAPAAHGYNNGSYIDEWYEQSRIYNNPAYAENWDSGSAHMTIMGLGGEAKGAANGGIAGGGQQTTEETEEYFHEQSGGAVGSGGMANGSAMRDETDGEARFTTSQSMMMSETVAATQAAESAVIVDTLTPAVRGSSAAETVLVEEETTERRAEESRLNQTMHPIMTSLDTDHNQMSSLSPATIDMLDSASAYNAQVAAKTNGVLRSSNPGYFSHTSLVPRYGARRAPPDSEDYITSESYESDYHSDYRRPPPPKYHEEAGMTIILDAQPSRGLEVENVEYEVLTDDIPGGASSGHGRSGYTVAEHSSVHRGGSSSYHNGGTIPRNGFTIELEPETYNDSGMVAEREEYVLTDDEGLAPEFFTDAPRSPKQRRYHKTTTRTMKESSGDDRY